MREVGEEPAPEHLLGPQGEQLLERHEDEEQEPRRRCRLRPGRRGQAPRRRERDDRGDHGGRPRVLAGEGLGVGKRVSRPVSAVVRKCEELTREARWRVTSSMLMPSGSRKLQRQVVEAGQHTQVLDACRSQVIGPAPQVGFVGDPEAGGRAPSSPVLVLRCEGTITTRLGGWRSATCAPWSSAARRSMPNTLVYQRSLVGTSVTTQLHVQSALTGAHRARSSPEDTGGSGECPRSARGCA